MSSRYKPDPSRVRVLENFNSLISERSSRSGSTSTSSKYLNREYHQENISPYLQKKLEQLANRTPKLIVREKPKFSTHVFEIIWILDKFTRNRKNFAFNLIGKIENSPVAFTQCPRCDHIGLSLLTTSTKDQFSPTFSNKLKKILPSRQIPQKIKEIHSNLAVKQENIVIDKIPRLNFGAMNKLKIRKEVTEGVKILEQIFNTSKKQAFKRINLFDASFIEHSSIESTGIDRKYTFGYVESQYDAYNPKPKESLIFHQSFFVDYPSPTFSQKTAFKILFTRIKKLIFRRKLKVFLTLSKTS